MRSALLALLLIVPQDTPDVHAAHVVTMSTSNQTLPPLFGLTWWDCRDAYPRSMIADELLDVRWVALLPVVRAHEAAHRATRRDAGSCRAANAALRDRPAQLADEVRTFCAGIRAGLASRWYDTAESGYMDAARALAYAYPFGLTVTQAHALMVTACPDTRR
jgi:hypothetical protein